MSSLWSQTAGTFENVINLPQQLQLRHVPHLSTGKAPIFSFETDDSADFIDNLFHDMKTSWMYGAAIELSLNGSEPVWSSEGWSFVPFDLSALPVQTVQNTGGTANLAQSPTNVSVGTQAIRARLECSQYEQLNNDSTWISSWYLTNSSTWDQDSSPQILTHGYQLGWIDSPTNMNDDTLWLTGNPYSQASDSSNSTEKPNSTYTYYYANWKRLLCCQNLTDGEIGRSSVGYWSPNLDLSNANPYKADSWPKNFTVKWIRGRPVEGYRLAFAQDDDEHGVRTMWAEKPEMAALNCLPVLEVANASVTVDAKSGRVTDFDILNQPQPDTAAWADDFQAWVYNSTIDIRLVNVTTSHGILFYSGLLGAADISAFGEYGQDRQGVVSENTQEQTFNFRDPGLNVDYMSYAMLSQVGFDHDALLDPAVLERAAKKTFATFFVYFANNQLSLTAGGNVYQAPSERLPDYIGRRLSGGPDDYQYFGPYANLTVPNQTSPAQPTAVALSSAVATISQSVEVLQMSRPAACICMAILSYLIVTCAILMVASRRYNSALLRKVDSVADVAVLVAGSSKLLEFVRDRPLGSLKSDRSITARLGWFDGEGGASGWRIELMHDGKAADQSTTESQGRAHPRPQEHEDDSNFF